jgi:glutathione S-transferase
MPGPFTIWTYDWVPPGPQGPRGFVRDLRLRWALEEAGLPYAVRAVRFEDRTAPDHLARQPFAQVPALQDGEVTLFESGACLIHLADQSAALMPPDPQGRADTLQWLVAALNSVEMVSVPWWFIGRKGAGPNPLDGWLDSRLQRLEATMGARDWLAAGRFTVADLLMVDVLRVPALRARLAPLPALAAYVDRGLARPAFARAHQDQLDHFAKADAARAQG